MLPVKMFLVIAIVAGLGYWLGLGPATILGALLAMFSMIIAFGGALYPDLKLLAKFGPAMILATVGPRLLAEVSQPAAIAVVVLIIFWISLLPAIGPRFITVSIGLGIATLFGYAFRLQGHAEVEQVIAAPVLAVLVVIVMRVLFGLKDPDQPTRAAVAALLVSKDPSVVDWGIRSWRVDRQRRWLGEVLDGALRFRTRRMLLLERLDQLHKLDADPIRDIIEAAEKEAQALSAAVTAATGAPEASDRPPTPGSLPGATAKLIDELWDALDHVRDALGNQDRSPTNSLLGAEYAGRRVIDQLSWESAQFRHALRCAFGVLIALIIVANRPGDPLAQSFLIAVFVIAQPDFRTSAQKAWQRSAGTLLGGFALVAVQWLLPTKALLPIGLAAVFLGFSVQLVYPIVFNACMMLMIVSVNVTTRHLAPGPLLIEYMVLILVAVGLGLLVGFAVIPGVRPLPPLIRIGKAREAIHGALTAMLPRLRAKHSDLSEIIREQRRAAVALQGMINAPLRRRDDTEANRTALADADDALRGIRNGVVGMMVHGHNRDLAVSSIQWLARSLADVEHCATPPLADTEEQRLLLDGMAADILNLRSAAHSLQPA
ncbi:FUSC family protein [Pseudonocardiaceae bacterium YIM PH 21723]|nr:FUSC family protein [Pseudonocardiaceae bacterium YIM PH 21723]